MFLEKKYKILLMMNVLLVSLIFGASPTKASEFKDGKCQAFTNADEKLVLFEVIKGEDSNTLPTATDPPGGKVFCVKVKTTDTTVSWKHLYDESGGTLDWDWVGQEIVEPELDSKEGCIVPVSIPFNSLVSIWVTAGESKKPADREYLLNREAHFTGTGDPRCEPENRRIRYHFNEPGNSTYLYYLSTVVVEDQQLPNPIPKCTDYGGTKVACEADKPDCFFGADRCYARADTSIDCTTLSTSGNSGEPCILALHCKVGDNKACVNKTAPIDQNKAIDKFIASTHGKPDGYNGPLPDCAFTGSCRSIEDLIGLGVKVADWLFGIIAGLGFAFFVYGGVTMIFSFGNAEKVGQGKQILVAAVIGIVIAFSAYVLVGFIVKAIGINSGLLPF